MNYYFTARNEGNIPASYIPDVLEGNWYEDRCVSEYDQKKKKDYMLPNPNAWLYDTTYSELGQQWKNFPSTKQHFAIANDNYINFQGKNNSMYVTTNKHAFDERYRHTFRTPLNMRDYFKGKPEELARYRQSWTNKAQLFETTYAHDILSKTKNSNGDNK